MPSDATIINLVGDSMANMFAKCGVPEHIIVNNDKEAILDYGTFAFSVKNKTVTASFFFQDWKGTIKGVKYGDDRQNLSRCWGAVSDVKAKREGKTFDAYGWELTEPKANFWLYFDNDKVSRVQITVRK